MFAILSSAAVAQEPPTPAPPAQQLPPVDVIQKQPTPAATPQKKAAAKKKQVSPSPQPPAAVATQPNPETINPNSVYGASGSVGAAERAYESAITPVNPTQLTPTNLQGFSSSATNITPRELAEQQPRNLNEALTRVPGVIVINDDGAGHHGGIGMRGSPARRSRKLLVMEDGHTSNLALWLDPSVHYWAPAERIESLEVIRGTIITHGPNNNFGVINARALSPFGPEETVVSGGVGFTDLKGGCYEGACKDGEWRESYRWHIHTRQHADNVGLVLSYTGADQQGSWDTERLRFNDFHGALGWKGVDDDLVVSLTYARQRDNYDEQNFLQEYEAEGPNFVVANSQEEAEAIFDAQNRGAAERAFGQLGHMKSLYAPGSIFNTYVGDVWRGQIVHNAYLDDDTTVTSRLYAGQHTRDRYQTITPESFPNGSGGPPPAGPYDFYEDANIADPDAFEGQGYVFDPNTMFGRLRTFRHLGGEVRTEWANRNVLGFNQDIQAGIRYEYQDMTNRNFLGANNQILGEGDSAGATLFDRSLNANTVSAFLQTNIAVASDFNVLPGIRFEWYGVNRTSRVVAEEESEAEGYDEDAFDGGVLVADCQAANPQFTPDECLAISGLDFNPRRSESYSSFNALPGIAFAYTGLYRSTVYGGYHRGMSTGILRNEDFPAPDEIGDNFNLGFRSSAIKGFDYEVAGFYQLIENYQYGASFSDAGDRSYGRAKEVEIKGVELAGRLNSHPYTGGPLNFFTAANYTYAEGKFTDAPAFDDDGNIVGSFNGNRLPEVPFHVAALTVGVEGTTGWRWNASTTWTYRGSFFTDEGNTPYGIYGAECEEENAGPPNDYECEAEEAGEDGQVPSVWILSARFNLDLGNSGASVYVAGDNLLNEFYISDREDGIKPGMARTIWTGFKYKF
jgi:Fe(3+) dicitrate transport protein